MGKKSESGSWDSDGSEDRGSSDSGSESDSKKKLWCLPNWLCTILKCFGGKGGEGGRKEGEGGDDGEGSDSGSGDGDGSDESGSWGDSEAHSGPESGSDGYSKAPSVLEEGGSSAWVPDASGPTYAPVDEPTISAPSGRMHAWVGDSYGGPGHAKISGRKLIKTLVKKTTDSKTK